MKPAIVWTHPVVIGQLPEEGAKFHLEPDEAARAELAKFVGVIAVPRLNASFQVKPAVGGGAAVEGLLDATVTQQCGVTLEPFDNKVSEAISLRFAAEGGASAGIPEDELGADPDVLENGTLDLAAVATEFLALGIDPYPRKPGAVFEPPEESVKASAFAALEQLKRGKGKEND
jgi:uncharacterized metal-binding protein YceD (DUF177 family)